MGVSASLDCCSGFGSFAFMSLFEFERYLEGRSRLVTALIGLAGLQGSPPSRRPGTATWSSAPTSHSSGVPTTTGFRTRPAFKDGLRVQFLLAFGFKARARRRGPSVSSGTSSPTGALASSPSGTKATVAIPDRDGSGFGYLGLKGLSNGQP